MVIRDFKDTLVEIRKLNQRLDSLSFSQPSNLAPYATTAYVDDLVAKLQASTGSSSRTSVVSELDTVADENRILHTLEHIFKKHVIFQDGATLTDITVYNGSYSWSWTVDSSGKMFLQEEQGQSVLEFDNFGAGVTTNKGYVGANLEPLVDNTYNFGSASKQWKKIFAVDEELSGILKMTALTASLPVKTNASKQLSTGAINLASSEVTGILPVASGGSGASSFTANVPITGNGGSTFSQPVTVYSGTVYVALSSGVAATKALVISNGLVIS